MKNRIKKALMYFFDFFDDFKQEPMSVVLVIVLIVIATVLYVLFFLPFILPVISLKDWAQSENKTLWSSVKDKNASFIS